MRHLIVRTKPLYLMLVAIIPLTYPSYAGAWWTDKSPPTLTFAVTPAQIQLGGSATLTWSSTNATKCSASGAWNGNKATSSSAARHPTTVKPWLRGSYTYSFSCTGRGGTVKQSVTLQVTSRLDQQISAAQATATNPSPASSCGAISHNSAGGDNGFYWEIGNIAGIIADPSLGLSASGSVQPAGTGPYNYSRTTPLYIASASKWLYGTYVAEAHAESVNNQWQIPGADVPFLNFTSGYDNMADNCSYNATATVGDCVQNRNGATPSVPNGTRTSADIGRFSYNSGHLEVFEAGADPSIAGVMNGANYQDANLANAIMTAMGSKGIAISLNFVTPIPAGGVETTPGDYAAFLQGLLRISNPLVMRSLLRPTASDPYAVCTNPYDPACADSHGHPLAVYSPLPASESWHYAITHWIEDDPATGDGTYSSPGKFGFYPWIDSSKTYYGIVARYDTTAGTTPTASPYYQSVVCGRAIRAAFMTGVAQP